MRGSTQLALVRELLACRSSEELLGRVASYLADVTGRPVGAWLPIPGRAEMVLTAVEGCEPRTRSRILRTLLVVPTDAGREFESRFAVLSGSQRTSRLEVGGPVLLCDVGAVPRAVAGELPAVVEGILALQAAGSGSTSHAGLAVSQTAHELRGPIVAARAALDRAIEAGGPEAADLMRKARSELRYSYRLVEELLRWTFEGRTLRRRSVDLVRIVREAVRSCELEVGPKVTLTMPPRLDVRAHRVSLRGAVANIVRNALVHSPAPEPVEVQVTGGPESARIRVRDRGAGIPARIGTRVFEPFVREDGAAGGSGLGLFIAKRVIEAHEGRVWFDSAGPGTTFHVELPAAS